MGASFAFFVGVPGEYFKVQGNWRSDAYLVYPTIPAERRLTVSKAMARAIAAGVFGGSSASTLASKVVNF